MYCILCVRRSLREMYLHKTPQNSIFWNNISDKFVKT